MSFIQKLRDRSAVLIFVLIVLALLAFVLQDAFVGNTHHFFEPDNQTAIAKIGDDFIEYDAFNALLNANYDNYKRQNIPLDESARYTVMRSVWQQFINTQLLSADAKKLGLKVMQRDVQNLFLGGYVSYAIKQQLTGGHPEQYNQEEVKNYLLQMQQLPDNNPKKIEFTTKLLDPLLTQLLGEKWLTFLRQANYKPRWLRQRDSADGGTSVYVQMVSVPYTVLPDDSKTKITEEELNQELREKARVYSVSEEHRVVDLVWFDVRPTAKDSLTLWRHFNKIKPDFLRTKDAKAFLARYASEAPFSGLYLKAADLMQWPNRRDLLSLSEGQIRGPYKNGGIYEMVKLTDKSIMPDSVLCRHILIPTRKKNGEELRSDSAAKVLADSMIFYLRKGQGFDDLVKQYSADEGSKSNGGMYRFGYKDYAQLDPAFARTVFGGKSGDKKVVKTVFGYHYIEALQQKNPSMAYNFAFMRKTIKPSRETLDSVFRVATTFSAGLKNADDLVFQAKERHFHFIRAQNIQLTDGQIASLGMMRNAIKWAFNAKEGAVSDLYSGNKNNIYFLLALRRIIPADAAVDLNTTPPGQAFSLKQLLTYELENKKSAAVIKKQCQNYTDLKQIANYYKESVKQAQINWRPFFTAGSIVFPSKLVGAAFEDLQDKRIRAVASDKEVYFFVVEKKEKETRQAAVSGAATSDLDMNTLFKVLKKRYHFEDFSGKYY